MADSRFLRSPELRAMLWDSADGRCMNCGTPLEPGWHADHIIPYVVSRRTNPFEMEAKCPNCNQKKGARMVQFPHFEIDISPMRPGQRHGVDTIVDRILHKESHTALVKPMRYGKSDIIRVSGMWLWRDRLVSHVLVITPSQFLRDQFADVNDWANSLTRYNIPFVSHFGPVIPVYSVDRAPTLPFPPSDAIFAVATTQMANFHKVTLARWIESEIRKYGIPPVVFIDECETTSERNNWGNCVEVFSQAGAPVVLLTATPFRTDRKRIPGFEDILVPEATTPVRIGKKRRGEQGEELVDIYEGQKQVYRLEAHSTTSFREAWDEGTQDNPSPLCKVTFRYFDVDLTLLDVATDIKSQGKLSELNATDARKELMEVLRDPGVITHACGILTQRLASRRASKPDTVAIVYVGNDEASDADINKHAMDVQRAILKHNPSLNVVIATAIDGKDAQETIKAFRRDKGWKGDVLIVKQMGGRGLDCPRLKVCLDLSNVRAPGPMIQRVGRVMTLWRDGPDVKDWVRVADYICPADANARAVFQKFILDEGGGEAVVSDLEYVETIPAEEKEKVPAPLVLTDGAGLPQVFNDSDNIEARGEMIPEVEIFYQRIPGLNLMCTQPVFANVLEEYSLRRGTTNGGGQTVLRNINDEEEDWIARCNESASKITNLEMPERLGRRYKQGDRESGQMHARVSIEVWTRHKRMAGVRQVIDKDGKRIWPDVRDIHDIPKLKQMRENMERELHEKRNSNRAR